MRTNIRVEFGGIRKEKEGKRGSKQEREKESKRERERGERNKKRDFLGIPTIEARRSEKKSRFMHRELRLGIKILEFRQTPRDRKFSYLDYFLA